MFRKKVKDEDLINIIKGVKVEYLLQREGGLNAKCNWNDILSGGEK